MAQEKRQTDTIHKSVLLQEVLDGLNLEHGAYVLDGTLGGAGHSLALCRQIGSDGLLLSMDLDADALKRAENRLTDCPSKVILVNDNFRHMDRAAREHGLEGFDAVVLDLGLSSDQLEHSGRGFSFMRDEPLVLSFKTTAGDMPFTARDIVNVWEEEQIADVLYGYGEERFSRRIAKAIVEARAETAIETTKDLATIIEKAVPRWYRLGRINPATRTFQALRIAVNDEIDALREGLDKGLSLLKKSGRIAVISFHSIEDRIVKRAFQAAAREGRGMIITKKPITPSTDEVKDNPRARSAKLRIFESTQNPHHDSTDIHLDK
jgi:16S rRNA (cytosine1402-N4)-methyltransferase